jgi:hypothetical protein
MYNFLYIIFSRIFLIPPAAFSQDMKNNSFKTVSYQVRIHYEC